MLFDENKPSTRHSFIVITFVFEFYFPFSDSFICTKISKANFLPNIELSGLREESFSHLFHVKFLGGLREGYVIATSERGRQGIRNVEILARFSFISLSFTSQPFSEWLLHESPFKLQVSKVPCAVLFHTSFQFSFSISSSFWLKK